MANKKTAKKVGKFLKKNGGKLAGAIGTTAALAVGATYGTKKGMFSKGLNMVKGIFEKAEITAEAVASEE